MEFDSALLVASIPELLDGAWLTIQLTTLALCFGMLIGFGVAGSFFSRNNFLTAIAKAFILFFRGTPLLVQIFLIYYGMGQFTDTLKTIGLWVFFASAMNCALLALSLNSGAYIAEILRGGFATVPKGEIEAGQSLGLSGWQVFYNITVARGIRIVFPSIGNEIILLLKGTSLTSTITLMELTGVAQKLASDFFAPIEIFLASGIIYLAMVIVLTRIFKLIEGRLSYA